MTRTRAQLQRSNAMQHRDLSRLAAENRRLRDRLEQAANEIEHAITGRFPLVAKSTLRTLARRVALLRWYARDMP